jgi:hypothetical protein
LHREQVYDRQSERLRAADRAWTVTGCQGRTSYAAAATVAGNSRSADASSLTGRAGCARA